MVINTYFKSVLPFTLLQICFTKSSSIFVNTITLFKFQNCRIETSQEFGSVNKLWRHSEIGHLPQMLLVLRNEAFHIWFSSFQTLNSVLWNFFLSCFDYVSCVILLPLRVWHSFLWYLHQPSFTTESRIQMRFVRNLGVTKYQCDMTTKEDKTGTRGRGMGMYMLSLWSLMNVFRNNVCLNNLNLK